MQIFRLLNLEDPYPGLKLYLICYYFKSYSIFIVDILVLQPFFYYHLLLPQVLIIFCSRKWLLETSLSRLM